MKKYINKKGVGLVECLVALLLFSIITASVLTAFTSSGNQIKTQNDKHKLEIMASNILADFEGSKDYASFSNKFNVLGINTNAVYDDGGVSETLGTSGDSAGSYGFDMENIPVTVPFKRILIKKGEDGQYAIFKGENGEEYASFKGVYANNELQPNANFNEYKPNELYDKKRAVTVSGQSKIYQNQVSNRPTDFYSYTWTVNEDDVSFTYTAPGGVSKTATANSCSFDKYLLKKGYYLKPIKKDYDLSIGTTYDYFYFQVMNAFDGTPVKNESGKCLYYKLAVASLADIGNYDTSVNNFINNGTTTNTYVDFDKINYIHEEGWIVKTKYGEIDFCFANDNTVPGDSAFKNNILKDDSGDYFTGKWYFYPWMVSNIAKSGISEGSISNINSNYNIISQTDLYNEYVTKEGIKSDIYYSFVRDNKMLFFNSDAKLIFAYEGETEKPLKDLKDNYSFGNYSSGVYFDVVYDKWYKKGAVAKKEVKTVKFVDNPTGISKIEFYDKNNSPYITFNYSAAKYEDYKNDKNSILTLNGNYSEKYKYTVAYTNTKSNLDITDSTVLDGWKNVGGIRNKLNETFSNTKKTICRYAIMDTLATIKYCNYYKYDVTLKSANEIKNITSLETNLQIKRNGINLEFSGTQKATAGINKVSSVNNIKLNGSNTESRKRDRSWLSNVPGADDKQEVAKNQLSQYNSATSQAVKDIAAQWETVSSNGTASAEKSIFGCPEDFDATNISADWQLTSTPSQAEIFEIKNLADFTFDGSSCTVKVESLTEEQGTEIFTAHTDDFTIAGTSKAGCTYSVVAVDSANIDAKTYFITYVPENRTTELIAMVTFSNFTGSQKMSGKIIEPRIKIWLVPENKKPSDVTTIDSNTEYNKYIYCSYRKG